MRDLNLSRGPIRAVVHAEALRRWALSEAQRTPLPPTPGWCRAGRTFAVIIPAVHCAVLKVTEVPGEEPVYFWPAP
jgi:hypothetical protein